MTRDEMIIYAKKMKETAKERLDYFKEDYKKIPQDDALTLEARKVIIGMQEEQLDFFSSVLEILEKENKK